MINLRSLEFDAGEPGAREKFQQLILQLVKLKFEHAQDIRPNPGDLGIDVIEGKLTSGECSIWQTKYFLQIKDAQKAQIRGSFDRVVEESRKRGFTVAAWCLCVPCALSAEELTWWEKWSRDTSKATLIRIDGMFRSDIEQILMTPEARGIRKAFKFDDSVDTLEPIEEKPIMQLSLEDGAKYDNSLFIRKLLAAGITENMPARSQFFNAELLRVEIHDKADNAAKVELTNMYEKIYSMWGTRFGAAAQGNRPEEIETVYWDMLKSIEQMDKTSLASWRIPASFIHKQGFMQQLADICKIRWTKEFNELGK